MRRLPRVGFAAVALVLASAVASAQETPAMHAFEEGRTLALKGNCAAAIDKFTQSITAEPSIGAYLNRGACRAQLGDPAHAWADYAHAEELALAKGAVETERLGLARKGAADLQPKLLRIVVQVPGAIDGIELRIDAERFAASRFAEGVAVDPATAHRVTATAPNYRPWTKDGVTGAAGSTVTLTAALSAEPPAAVDQATPPPSSGALPAPPPPQGTAAPESPAAPQTQRTIGLVVGGLGVVGVAVGGVFGLVAQSKLSDAKSACSGQGYPSSCAPDPTQAAANDNASAKSAATASTVAFIVGGAALATGAVLFFTAPSSSSGAARVRLTPVVAEHTGGVSVSGNW